MKIREESLLKQIEKEILTDIYKMCLENQKSPLFSNYNLIEIEGDSKARNQEFASYLISLKAKGFVEFEDNKVLHTGGKISEKYNNNVAVTFVESIKITKKGIKFVEEN